MEEGFSNGKALMRLACWVDNLDAFRPKYRNKLCCKLTRGCKCTRSPIQVLIQHNPAKFKKIRSLSKYNECFILHPVLQTLSFGHKAVTTTVALLLQTFRSHVFQAPTFP